MQKKLSEKVGILSKNFCLFEKILPITERYGIAYVSGVFAAIIGAALSYYLTMNEIFSAYSAAFFDGLAFYTIMALKIRKETIERIDESYKNVNSKTISNMVFEFLPAFIVSSGLTKPLAILFGITFFGNGLGVFVGKILGDIIYYSIAFTFFHIRCRSY